jgi:hypothetical protein
MTGIIENIVNLLVNFYRTGNRVTWLLTFERATQVTASLLEKLCLEQQVKQTVETNKRNGEIRSGLMSALNNALGWRARGRLVGRHLHQMAVFVLQQSDRHCRVYTAHKPSKLYRQKNCGFLLSFQGYKTVYRYRSMEGVCVEIIAK